MAIRIKNEGVFDQPRLAGNDRSGLGAMDEVLLLRGFDAGALGASDEVLMLRGFGVTPAEMVPLTPSVGPAYGGGQQAALPAEFRAGGELVKIGPFRTSLGRLTEGGEVMTITDRMLDNPAAFAIQQDAMVQVMQMSKGRCAGFGAYMFPGQCWGDAPYKGLRFTKGYPLFPPILDGKLALWRYKHPVSGKDFGIFMEVTEDEDVGHYYRFTTREIKKSWYERLWDFIKELVVDIIKFIGNAIRDIAQGILCNGAKQLLGKLADVADKKQGLSSTIPTYRVTFTVGGATQSKDVLADSEGAAIDQITDIFPNAVIGGAQKTSTTVQQAAVSAGIGPAQLAMLVGGGLEAAAIGGIAFALTEKICPQAGPPLPPPPPSSKTGIVVGVAVAGGAAALLYYLFR